MPTFPLDPTRSKTLAIGFATAVAMWAIGYLAMMNPGLVIGEALFAATLGCLFVGGLVAGRWSLADEPGWFAGVKAGLLTATVNLLLIGSLAGGVTSRDKPTQLLLWMAGNYVLSIALAASGGSLGRFARDTTAVRAINQPRRQSPPASYPPLAPSLLPSWYSRFTFVAACTVFLLLITGGLVTGLKAGLAVPDWPNSFGHNMLLYPLSEMIGGIYYEHAHRLYGMLVGVTAITLAVSMFWFDDRRWMRTLAISYLLMVCVQGVLGGTRVTEKSLPLAIVHGMFGQIVFATIVSIAAFTSSTWRQLASPLIVGHVVQRPTSPPNREEAIDDVHGVSRQQLPSRASLVLVLLLIIQLGLGAMYRHLNRAETVAEPGAPVHVLFTHIGIAMVVAIQAVVVGGRAWTLQRARGGGRELATASDGAGDEVPAQATEIAAGAGGGLPVLPTLGKALILLVGAQLLLGVSATIAVWMRASGHAEPPPIIEVVVTTAHQATGALLLATATLVMLWSARLKRPADRCDSAAQSEPAAPQSMPHLGNA